MTEVLQVEEGDGDRNPVCKYYGKKTAKVYLVCLKQNQSTAITSRTCLLVSTGYVFHSEYCTRSLCCHSWQCAMVPEPLTPLINQSTYPASSTLWSHQLSVSGRSSYLAVNISSFSTVLVLTKLQLLYLWRW